MFVPCSAELAGSPGRVEHRQQRWLPVPAVVLATAMAAAALLAGPLAAQDVRELVVAPARVTLEAGATQLLVASSYDSLGNLVLSDSVSYRSSDTTVVRVSPAGEVEGRQAGIAHVEARAGSAAARVVDGILASHPLVGS